MPDPKPSKALLRHLGELVDMEARAERVIYWHPAGSGERRCAASGERIGLLARDWGYRGAGYEMTDAGRAAVAASRAGKEPCEGCGGTGWDAPDPDTNGDLRCRNGCPVPRAKEDS